MAVATATDDRITVVTSDKGQKGDEGTAGLDGQGFNSVRKSLIDSPLLRLFTPNNIAHTLAGTLTATRATTATYIDRYGTVQTAAIDEMREEENGWLIEGASTNLITYSEDFTNTNWLQTIYGGTNWNLTANTGDISAPDGTSTAEKLVNTSTNSIFARKSGLSLTSGLTYTASIWVYVPTQAGVSTSWALRTDYNDNDAVTGAAQTTFDQWVRLSVTTTISAARTNIDFEMLLDGGSPQTGDTFYIWGAQLEQLPFKTSYIPTAASTVTRSADVITAQSSGNIPLIQLGKEYSVAFGFIRMGSNLIQSIFEASPSATGRELNIIEESGGKVLHRLSDNSGQDVRSKDDDDYIVFTVSSDGTIARYNEDFEKTINTLVDNPDIDYTSTLYFGSRFNGAERLYGYLKDFRLYDFALNDDEANYLAGV